MKFIRQLIKRTSFFRAYERNISRMVEIQLEKQRLTAIANTSKSMGVEPVKEGERELVVSLTTHAKRIFTVYRTIECLFDQSLKANRIVLYIGRNEYQSDDELPLVLKRQMERGLEVRFVEDLGPYTKIIHALKEFPDSNIITVDDDIWYPSDTFERLVRLHTKQPEAICSIAARVLEWKDKRKGKFKTYEYLSFAVDGYRDTTSPMYVAEGFAGVLYPPGCFTDEVFNKDAFLKLAPKADDLWLKAMGLLSGTPIYAARCFTCPAIEILCDFDVQDMGLYNFNFGQKGNDKQWKALCDYYNLYDMLKD